MKPRGSAAVGRLHTVKLFVMYRSIESIYWDYCIYCQVTFHCIFLFFYLWAHGLFPGVHLFLLLADVGGREMVNQRSALV